MRPMFHWSGISRLTVKTSCDLSVGGRRRFLPPASPVACGYRTLSLRYQCSAFQTFFQKAVKESQLFCFSGAFHNNGVLLLCVGGLQGPIDELTAGCHFENGSEDSESCVSTEVLQLSLAKKGMAWTILATLRLLLVAAAVSPNMAASLFTPKPVW